MKVICPGCELAGESMESIADGSVVLRYCESCEDVVWEEVLSEFRQRQRCPGWKCD